MPMKVFKKPKNRETTIRRDERGSVMLEFVLVLPIYLFLIGGTMLMYELFMAKLHLQEANRTLAWAVCDRYFAGRGNEEDFKAVLYDAVCSYYARRNDIDNAIHKNPKTLWGFGKNRDLWGVGIIHKLKPDGTKSWPSSRKYDVSLMHWKKAKRQVHPLRLEYQIVLIMSKAKDLSLKRLRRHSPMARPSCCRAEQRASASS